MGEITRGVEVDWIDVQNGRFTPIQNPMRFKTQRERAIIRKENNFAFPSAYTLPCLPTSAPARRLPTGNIFVNITHRYCGLCPPWCDLLNGDAVITSFHARTDGVLGSRCGTHVSVELFGCPLSAASAFMHEKTNPYIASFIFVFVPSRRVSAGGPRSLPGCLLQMSPSL